MERLDCDQDNYTKFGPPYTQAIIRPSSQGADHLTVSWKVTDQPPIIAHIDVKEENKENDFSLGQSLLIGDEAFEDLDEIIAR